MKGKLVNLGSMIVLVIVLGCSTTGNSQNFWQPTKGPLGQGLWTILVTQEGDYYVGTGNGKVFKKASGNAKWDLLFNSPTSSTITLIHKAPDGSVYISDDDLLFKSSSDESSWQIINDQNLWVRSMVVADNGDAFFGSLQGIYRSQNGGPLEPIDFDSEYPYGKYIFSMTKGTDGSLYAGTAREIYKTVQMDEDTIIWAKQDVQTSSVIPTFYNFAVRDNGDIYAATDVGLFANYADDANDSWLEIGGWFIQGRNTRNVSIGKDGRLFFNMAGSGVYYSDDDNDWFTTGFDSEHITRPGFFYDPLSDQLIVGTWNGVWSAPSDNLASPVKVGLPSVISRIMSDQPKLFVIENNERLLESTDAGDTWTFVESFTEGKIVDYCEQPNGTKYMAVWGGLLGKPGIQIYDHAVFGDLPYLVGFPANVKEVYDIFLGSEGTLLAATDNGLFAVHPETFELTLRSAVGSEIRIFSLAEDSENNLFAGTSNGLYVSFDHGQSWAISSLPNERVNAITISSQDEIIVATNEWLYLFENYNATPVTLGDDIALRRNQFFEFVVVDDYGHVHVKCEDGIFFASSYESPWESHSEELPKFIESSNLHVFSNTVYFGTGQGLFKHQETGVATVILDGIGAFDYNGQIQGNPNAITIPEGLNVTITSTAQPDVGVYEVVGVVNDPNYVGRAQGFITIKRAEQTINFEAIPDKYSTDSPFPIVATCEAGQPTFEVESGPASVSGNQVTLDGQAGVVKIIASHSGSNNYKAALPVSRLFEVFQVVTDTEDEIQSKILVYPVPSREFVKIKNQSDALKSIKVTDPTGRTLDYISVTSDSHEYNLDVTRYKPGLLILTVSSSGGRRENHRIIVEK